MSVSSLPGCSLQGKRLRRLSIFGWRVWSRTEKRSGYCQEQEENLLQRKREERLVRELPGKLIGGYKRQAEHHPSHDDSVSNSLYSR